MLNLGTYAIKYNRNSRKWIVHERWSDTTKEVNNVEELTDHLTTTLQEIASEEGLK